MLFVIQKTEHLRNNPPIIVKIACVASVSARVRREKLGREQKKRNDGGGGGERTLAQ